MTRSISDMQLVLIVLMASQIQGPGPAQRIQVSCQNGQLEIDVVDAPLGDVLSLVALKAGVAIHVPAGATERVTRHIGPGPVISVLGSFLNETDYNYLLVDPGTGPGSRLQATLYPKGSTLYTPPHIETSVLQAAEANLAEIAAAGQVVRPPRENLFVISDARQKAREERTKLVRSTEKMRALEIERFKKLNAQP